MPLQSPNTRCVNAAACGCCEASVDGERLVGCCQGIYREIENSALEEQPLAVDDIVQRIWQNEDR